MNSISHSNDTVLNKDLRRKIIDMVVAGEDGHIPSAFSILDIITLLYRDILKIDAVNPEWVDRDYFILSKGHGCLAQYVNLHRHGFITDHDIAMFCKRGGILGEHPDRTKIPGIEASTGSLGHGLSFTVGIALGLKIQSLNNRLFVLLGDGECQEGTVWEAVNVARNRQLGNLCAIVDWNQSAMQLMPVDDMPKKWAAFGWNVQVVDGHSESEIADALRNIEFKKDGIPSVIIAKTIKGKGVSLLEGHGMWHHRIPNPTEYKQIMEALS
ncbi:transketolase [Herbaspirillum sp. RTI4]|uniref:transketolase n=1 Tax=Herbaspirillum sp. RTI4 TaxID=3048640 RepID=UPI002AB5536C|nr:transketolase [Herbaspirillum sp. RTI4]MDY7577035.1 transketolase [Herbaspirillum sp. RTI4]MEA9983106.1 transketolase [Herbaspirillum sp. RTI4]